MTAQVEICTLLLLELLGTDGWFGELGVGRASEILARHDRGARELLERFAGREIEKTRRFLLLFERPVDAVRYALAYQDALAELGAELGRELPGRVVVHLGEVLLRPNTPETIARGAKAFEVEGPARLTLGRMLALARGGQILLNRAAFELARRSLVGEDADAELRWVEHGRYRFPPAEQEIEIFEVGLEGRAPLEAPGGVEEVRRAVVAAGPAQVWHAITGEAIPQRPHWFLERRLRRPARGEVWLAVHGKTREPRIFKFAAQSGDRHHLEAQVETFRRLRGAVGLRRDLVRLIDWDFEREPAFLEFERVPRRTLPEWVAEVGGFGELSLAERVEWLLRVSEAVAAIHGAGEVHADLRPEHVLVAVDENDHPVGICLAELPSGRGAVLAEGRSDPYRAPELAAGGPATAAADVYAMGVILYQLMAGDFERPLGPFWERDVEHGLVRSDIAAMIEPMPAARLADAGEVLERLGRFGERSEELEAEHQEDGAEIEALETRLSHLRRLATALAAAAVLLLALLLWSLI